MSIKQKYLEQNISLAYERTCSSQCIVYISPNPNHGVMVTKVICRQQGMPFATRSSELFRDRMLAGHGREGTAYPPRQNLSSNMVRDSAMSMTRQRPAAFLGQGPDLDRQMAAEVDRALLARQSGGEGQGAVARGRSMLGSRDRAVENIEMIEQIEEVIRRRRTHAPREEIE